MLLHYMVEELQSSKRCYSVKVSRFIVDNHDRISKLSLSDIITRASAEESKRGGKSCCRNMLISKASMAVSSK